MVTTSGSLGGTCPPSSDPEGSHLQGRATTNILVNITNLLPGGGDAPPFFLHYEHSKSSRLMQGQSCFFAMPNLPAHDRSREHLALTGSRGRDTLDWRRDDGCGVP